VTFNCVDGNPRFVSWAEIDYCVYSIVIEVPWSVCAAKEACCTPPTYISTRLEADGSLAARQADGARQIWLDQSYRNAGVFGVLCSKGYNQCFTFTPTTCVPSDFRPAPSQCFGRDVNWQLVKQGSLILDGIQVLQTAWFSKTDGYALTMPLGKSSDCVTVSGNKMSSYFEFGLVPNTTLWELPRSCLKLLR